MNSTQNTEQTREDRIRREAALARMRVAARVPIKLPPADAQVRAKVRAHIICVCLGTGAALFVTVVFHAAAYEPFSILFSGTPNIVMEVLDRLRNR